MKLSTANRNRTRLCLALAVVVMGAANAGGLQVARVDQPANAAAGKLATWVITNHGESALHAVRVFVDGREATGCSATTTQGNPFTLAGHLRDGDSVRCSSAA
ncbi:MAG TPA: hypothetical protein VFN09_06235, partial [Rhodanobacteraceae bacterium]|nr:hypothetical protein [Rhodanobacteraceae bacterium]